MNLDPLVSFTLIVVFVAWFYGPWQDTCADYARQLIFEQRDKLFDLASSGKISFNSREYRTIRDSLNSAIRFSHEMTIARLIFLLAHYKLRVFDNTSSDILESTSRIADPNLRSKITSIKNRSFAAMVAAMLGRSLVCVVCGIVLSPMIAGLFFMYFWWIGFFVTVGSWARGASRMIGELLQIEAEYEEKCL